MTKKSLILQHLKENTAHFVSGEELAARFGISRTAVWKAVKQLREEGYRIDSVSNKGYRLAFGNDVLSAEGVTEYLQTKGLCLQYFREITSTNTVLKTMAADGAEEGLVLIAEHQSMGKGRLGRSFYSPAGTGLYMSILLKPKTTADRALHLTTAAAVAAAIAIEELSGKKVMIKWVNDLYLDSHKICGILTEASVDCESGMMNYAVIGIGINTLIPEGKFPEELQDIAGSVFNSGEEVPDLRCRLAASVLDHLMVYYADPDSEICFEEYRKRSFLIGKPVNIIRQDDDPVPAVVEDLDRDYSLIVRLENGTRCKLRSGEVSVRPVGL